MEIQGIQLSNLPNGAHFAYMEEVAARITALIAANETAKARVDALVTTFTTALGGEDTALKVSQKSLLTDKISAADNKRDRLYGVLKGLVDTWYKYPDEAIHAIAEVLNQSIIDYNINPSDQLDKETGMLTNFIIDWQTKYQTQVAALHLTETVAQLKACNDELKSLVSQRNEEYTVRNATNLRAARSVTDNAYRALIRRINAYLEIGEDDTFNDLAAYLNTRIVNYKQQAYRHSSGGKPNNNDKNINE